jgi:hypothetical protein
LKLATKTIKYLGINLVKEVKYPCKENIINEKIDETQKNRKTLLFMA